MAPYLPSLGVAPLLSGDDLPGLGYPTADEPEVLFVRECRGIYRRKLLRGLREQFVDAPERFPDVFVSLVHFAAFLQNLAGRALRTIRADDHTLVERQ